MYFRLNNRNPVRLGRYSLFIIHKKESHEITFNQIQTCDRLRFNKISLSLHSVSYHITLDTEEGERVVTGSPKVVREIIETLCRTKSNQQVPHFIMYM